MIAAVAKTFASLAGLVFMLLMISQFIAYFNFSNLPSVLAIVLAEALEAAGIGALPLLIGMIIVIMLLDVIIPGVVPKWAIFAPIFIPLFIQLGIPPQTGLAAYRVGDSPINVVTPLMVYLPFMVTIAQRYQKDVGHRHDHRADAAVRRLHRASPGSCCSSCGSCWVSARVRDTRSRPDLRGGPATASARRPRR